MDESCSLIQEQLKTKYFSCFLFTLRPFYIALAQYEAAKWIQTSPHPFFLQDNIKYNRTKKKKSCLQLLSITHHCYKGSHAAIEVCKLLVKIKFQQKFREENSSDVF